MKVFLNKLSKASKIKSITWWNMHEKVVWPIILGLVELSASDVAYIYFSSKSQALCLWCYACVTFNNKKKLFDWLSASPQSKFKRLSPFFSGGFYQDEMGQVDCKNCSTGTYVPETDHPGRSAADCRACPYGKWACWIKILIIKILKQVITRGTRLKKKSAVKSLFEVVLSAFFE